jgi:hypothetical protein
MNLSFRRMQYALFYSVTVITYQNLELGLFMHKKLLHLKITSQKTS